VTATPGYDHYVASLAALRGAPEAHTTATRSIAQTYDSSVVFANNSVEEVQKRYDSGRESIEARLRNAAIFLEKVGEKSRIPPRIKPSVVPPSATASEIAEALDTLARSTVDLGMAVDALLAEQTPVAPQKPPVLVTPTAGTAAAGRGFARKYLIIGGIVVAALVIAIVSIVIATS